jgi:hypothetical protein
MTLQTQSTKEPKMYAPRAARPSTDVAMEVTNLSAALGILTLPLFPFALPGLLLVVVPLALLAMVGVLLAAPFVLPFWLARIVLRSRSHRRTPPVPAVP